jgi:hypothetical protein
MHDQELALTPDAFLAQLSELLSSQPSGTVALLGDFCVAWLGGLGPVLAYVREDNFAEIDEEFDLHDCEWLDWLALAQAWLSHPIFTDRYRAQLLPWIARSIAGRHCTA